jgi:Uma2 family endonuclease
MTEKAERYAEAGIADYWIVDLVGNRLLVYRDPDPAAATYRAQQAYGPADRVAPLVIPTTSILVADLLP